MKAAVISSFDLPPHYGHYADPAPQGPGEMLVEVLAAGLHHVTRGQASGVHYSSSGGLPLVPGIDGVGRGSDGKLRYFVQGPGQVGTMADRTVIELDHSIELPLDSDAVTVAAAMNPAMASWLALRCRVPFQSGQKVLVLGATGSSGSMAVQIARHLGASQVIAAGRDEQKLSKLPALGATEIVPLGDDRLGALAREVDVVLDFVWGESAVRAMETYSSNGRIAACRSPGYTSARWREKSLPFRAPFCVLRISRSWAAGTARCRVARFSWSCQRWRKRSCVARFVST